MSMWYGIDFEACCREAVAVIAGPAADIEHRLLAIRRNYPGIASWTGSGVPQFVEYVCSLRARSLGMNRSEFVNYLLIQDAALAVHFNSSRRAMGMNHDSALAALDYGNTGDAYKNDPPEMSLTSFRPTPPSPRTEPSE